MGKGKKVSLHFKGRGEEGEFTFLRRRGRRKVILYFSRGKGRRGVCIFKKRKKKGKFAF